MDLSIIIPCHNSEHVIQPMLESLLFQVFTADVELIFVCDHCEDNTRQYLETYWRASPNHFKKILVIDCDVQRCGLARNVGLEHSEGRYIWFVDSDDWLLDNWAITKVVTALDLVKDAKYCRVPYTSAKFQRGVPVMVWQYIFRRDAIGDHRFSGIQPNEDWEFMLAFDNAVNVDLATNDIYYYNYMRPQSNIWKHYHSQLPSDEWSDQMKELQRNSEERARRGTQVGEEDSLLNY